MTSNRQLYLLALSIFLGVLFPALAGLARPLLMPTIFLLFTFAILQVPFRDAASVARRERSVWIILLWQLIVLPLVVAVIAYPLLKDQWYVFAVVSMCTSSITATTALARILGLNDALALVVCLCGTLFMPLPLFLFLNYLGISEVQIDWWVYLNRILVFIVSPFVLVYMLRRIMTPHMDEHLRNSMPVWVLTLLMVFGLSVMDGVQALLLSDPLLLGSYVLLAFTLSVGVQVLTVFALRFLGVCNARTASLLCAYRNMGLVVAIAGGSLGDHFLIYVGVWQLPMYILPLLLQKYYRVTESPISPS